MEENIYHSPKGNQFNSKREYIESVIEHVLNTSRNQFEEDGFYLVIEPVSLFLSLDISYLELVNCGVHSGILDRIKLVNNQVKMYFIS